MFGGFLFLPQYLQLVRGLTPLQSSLWTLPWAVAFIIGSLVTPAIVRRLPPATLMSIGLLFASVGFGVLAGLDGSTGFGRFAAATFIFSLGMAPVFTLTTDLIVGSAPPERAGAASAISETSAEFGGAIGIAIFGSIGVAIYRALLGGALGPMLPPDLAERAMATLGGALDVAQQLPDGLGSQVTATAQEAFIRGVRLSAVISAVASIGLAAFVSVTLRRPRGDRGPVDAPRDDSARAEAHASSRDAATVRGDVATAA